MPTAASGVADTLRWSVNRPPDSTSSIAPINRPPPTITLAFSDVPSIPAVAAEAAGESVRGTAARAAVIRG